MDRVSFAAEMAATSVATRSDISDETYRIYFDEFENWETKSFKNAMKKCRADLNRFPTVFEIKSRFSKHDVCIDAAKKYIDIASEEKSIPLSMDQKIDSLEEGDVLDLFRSMAGKFCGISPALKIPNWTESDAEKAAQYSANQFFKNKSDKIYRGVVSDELKRLAPKCRT